MIPTSSPNRVQKDWREDVRAQGCVFGFPGPVEIHHVVGRTAKHYRIPIGHEFILPVSNEGHRKAEAMTKDEQKQLFLTVCRRYLLQHETLPFGSEVMFAIMDYHR